MNKDVIIIGGGPAGLAAGLYACRGGLDTVILEKSFIGGQAAITYEVENYPGFEHIISGSDLTGQMLKQAEKFGLKVIYEEVTKMDLLEDLKEVSTEKTLYKGRIVILAMGASPRKLGLEKEKILSGKGISYCATCDGAFFKNADTGVVGGGDTAVEDAVFLSRFVNKVYLIHRRSSLRASKALQKQLEHNDKVEILFNSRIKELLGEKKLEGIIVSHKKSKQEKTIHVQGLFVAIGTIPNNQALPDIIKTDDNGYIDTDENMRTNIKGVYAAGDIRAKGLRQIVTASSDGAVAAYFAEKYLAGLG